MITRHRIEPTAMDKLTNSIGGALTVHRQDLELDQFSVLGGEPKWLQDAIRAAVKELREAVPDGHRLGQPTFRLHIEIISEEPVASA